MSKNKFCSHYCTNIFLIHQKYSSANTRNGEVYDKKTQKT